jgi:hypothetical protein
MSEDGAELGISAESGMKAAIGGSTGQEPRRTRAQMRAIIEATPFDSGNYTYNTSANAAAKIMLMTVEGHPEIDWENLRTEPKYAYLDKDGNKVEYSHPDAAFTKIEDGWYEVMLPLWEGTILKEEWDKLGLSGFQWGWAVNCVRWILDWPPVGNPAILHIGGEPGE